VCLSGTCSYCRSDADCLLPTRCNVPTSGLCGCPDRDGDGRRCDDCNDNDPTIFPGATEVCDGKDNDCNGVNDENTQNRFYADQDHDGLGDPSLWLELCSPPTGYVPSGTDCDDNDPSARPGAIEVCDSRDNDCDGTVDEGVKKTYFRDSDGDGHGDPGNTLESCLVPAVGYVEVAADCDDTRADVNPAAHETCNARDDDCDGAVDGIIRSCDNSCGAGVETCQAGTWVGCTAPPSVTLNAEVAFTGPGAVFDCLTLTTGAKVFVSPQTMLSTRNWLRVESNAVLQLAPGASLDVASDLLFADQSVMLATDATVRASSSVQIGSTVSWYVEAPQAAPYSGGGSPACASALALGVSGAGGGARGGNGGQGGTCGTLITQPTEGAGGSAAVKGADGLMCPADATTPGGVPSGGAGGAPVSGGGGGANYGRGGAGAGGTYLGVGLDGGAGGVQEPANGEPVFGGGGGGSAGAGQVCSVGEACQGRGGAGAGILRISSAAFVNQGVLLANGGSGQLTGGLCGNLGGGGGGAGGTLVFKVQSFDNRGAISVNGGNGAAATCNVVGIRCGGGGGGGGGRVFISGQDGGTPTILDLGNIFAGGGLGGAGKGGGSSGEPGGAGSVVVQE